MAKTQTVFVCQQCESEYPKWQGQCVQCGAWNSLVEQTREKQLKQLGSVSSLPDVNASVVSLPEARTMSASKQRFSTTIDELDRVLGAENTSKGMVPGAVMLIGGEPGIGKSTLLTQVVVGMLTTQAKPRPILYVCGEESPGQIVMRLERLYAQTKDQVGGLTNKAKEKKMPTMQQALSGLEFITSTVAEVIAELIRQKKPQLVIVDSIQTITSLALNGAAGSIGQVRESTEQITVVAKQTNTPVFLVGHVTKEGTISGPKVLEHMVDSVLELSGERTGEVRLLRAAKNRFGATDEVGVFRVTSYGYESVANPTELFLEHATEPVPGSATVCVMEGTRPLLLEVQALVVSSQLAMPRRVGRGIELSRIQVLSAVLQRHSYLPLGSYDIFLSVAGGYAVKEPAVDLGLAVAIASSLSNKKIPAQTVFIGEVGLLGEIRSVPYLERRIKEAKRLGFEHIITKQNYPTVRSVVQHYGLKKSALSPDE
jgi:DNA repair protein RadA/Sms